VVTPPADQEDKLRVGIFYFSRPNDDYLLLPLPNSPTLKGLGFDKPLDQTVTYTSTEFIEAKKHGYMKPDFDHDRPVDPKIHEDPFRGGDRFEVTKPLVSYPGIKA